MGRYQKIGLGGGCHWCTECIFQSLKGVTNVQQGWISSFGEFDSFSEAVVVHYEAEKIDLSTLISIHLRTHSCTSDHALRNKYRSAIYSFSQAQSEIAIQDLERIQKEFKKPIITKVLRFNAFKINKKEYLNYFYNNPEKAFCTTYIHPKLRLLIDTYAKEVDHDKVSIQINVS